MLVPLCLRKRNSTSPTGTGQTAVDSDTDWSTDQRSDHTADQTADDSSFEVIVFATLYYKADNQTDCNADQSKRDVLWSKNQSADDVGQTTDHCAVKRTEYCCCQKGSDGVQVERQLHACSNKSQHHIQRNTDTAECQSRCFFVLQNKHTFLFCQICSSDFLYQYNLYFSVRLIDNLYRFVIFSSILSIPKNSSSTAKMP